MTGTASVRCGACGYTSEVKTYEHELADAKRDCLELSTDLREANQRCADLLIELDVLRAEKSVSVTVHTEGSGSVPLEPALADVSSVVGPGSEDDIS